MRVLLFVFILVSLCLATERTYGDMVVKTVVSVHDGDTFNANLSKYHPIISDTVSIRVFGIDTPEMTDDRPEIKALALKAKQLTKDLLAKGKVIKLKNVRRDKYFRILAEVYIDKTCLADTLIKAGLAKPYDGGTKTAW